MKKKKQQRKGTKIKTKPKKLLWLSNIISSRTITIAFLIGFIALFVHFVLEFTSMESIKRGAVLPDPSLQYWQYLLYTLTATCFGYFSFKYFNPERAKSPWDLRLLTLAFLSIASVYLLSFNADVLPNGDNAEYMIISQSLVERGGAYRLDTPNETPNSLASLGLPILLSPIYAFWGFDFVKMKILIMLLGLLIFPLLYKLFRIHHGRNLSAILTIVAFASPYLVSSAVPIMTEMPYLFWSLLALILINRYVNLPSSSWKYLALSLLAVIMCYLTRAVGLSMLFAFIVHLFCRVNWLRFIGKRNWRSLVKDDAFRRFSLVTAPILVFGIIWQVYQSISGISQVSLIMSTDISGLFRANLNSAIWVMPQMLFEEEVYRWFNFIQGNSLLPISFLWIVLLLILLFGLITSVLRNQLLAIYTLFVMAVVLSASLTAAEMVIIRYLTIILPFLIYYFFIGVLRICNLILERTGGTNYRQMGRLLGVLALSQILFTGFHGDRLNIESSSVGSGPEYYDFIDVAKWSKVNLPDDAYVLAVKPRIFYIFSGKKSGRLTTAGEVISDQYILDKLDSFKKSGVTHIILDRISGATRRNIFPLVEEHPELFQTMYLGQIASTSAVLKLK